MLFCILWPLSSSLAADRNYPKPKDWDQLVEAARKEGTVVVYRGVAFGPGGSLGDVFGKAYPGIKVLETVGGGSQQLSRILTERRAGLHIPDILIGGTTDPVLTLKPAGAVAPLKPLLLLPEMLDTSAWLTNRPWWTGGAIQEAHRPAARREGKTAYQASIALPSLRTDTPKTGPYAFDMPKPGASKL